MKNQKTETPTQITLHNYLYNALQGVSSNLDSIGAATKTLLNEIEQLYKKCADLEEKNMSLGNQILEFKKKYESDTSVTS
jgi:archaellum component FlaC